MPNPSFEDTIGCPASVDQVDSAVSWIAYRGSPDYFNSCNSGIVGVPSNIYDFQNAKTGNAYAGFYTYWIGLSNDREMIGIQLSQQLVIGQKYYVSLYASRAVNNTLSLNIANNKIGVRFSSIPYWFGNQVPIDNHSQVFTDSIISDTLNWVKISGAFTADSAYSFMSIGNHFTDSATSYLQYSSAVVAYYYIDDVCVSTDSLSCNPPVGINEIKNSEEFILFPNPFENKLNITVKRNELVELTLFDAASRKIFSQSFTNSTSINTEQLAKGIYLYEVRNKNGVIKKGKIVKPACR